MQAITKILKDSGISREVKLNNLLELDCSIYTNIGTDSTKEDKEKAYKESRKIYTAIQNLGNENSFLLGSFFLKTMDL